MGFMDKAKGMLKGNQEKVKDGIDKAADVADDKTDGKYSEHIDTGAEKAKDVVDDLTDE
jgi:MT0933-like antitoxin protein